MFETLFILPVSFWVVVALLIGGGLGAFRRMKEGVGLPMLAVLGTITAWYVGDAFYNDYAEYHVKVFDSNILDSAWWQVAWFLVVFLTVCPQLHRLINVRFPQRHSGIMELFKHGIGFPAFQRQLEYVFWGSLMVWLGLLLIALLVLQGQVIYFLFPFLAYKASPWSHGQIGAGFDCFSIVAQYLQLIATTMFGVVAALAVRRKIQYYALFFCLLSWPYFILDRTRNTMLAMVVPAVLSWVFLRLRGGFWKKATVLLVCFCAVNFWMKFVIANRSSTSITSAFQTKGFSLAAEKKVHNEGLNMFEELCWMSTFLDNGKYQVNWGQRYFAEMVNPIPRGLWPDKPLIGLDYSMARGSKVIDSRGTVDTTIATGIIGQGVANFGRFLGPMAAAILISLWVAFLVHLDLNIYALGRMPLYSLGLILTFNLGRDITLITLYPMVFGWIAIKCVERSGLVNKKQFSAAKRRAVKSNRLPQTKRAHG